MISFYHSISLAIGSLIGIVYGLLFLWTKALSFSKPSLTHLLFALRILSLLIFFLFVLREPQINFILVLITFFITFWLTIIIKVRDGNF